MIKHWNIQAWYAAARERRERSERAWGIKQEGVARADHPSEGGWDRWNDYVLMSAEEWLASRCRPVDAGRD